MDDHEHRCAACTAYTAKATVYSPTVSVLASREQLCIDKHVMEVESNAAKTAVCRQKVKQRMCGHYIGFEQSTVDPKSLGVMDIEDLVRHGNEAGETAHQSTNPNAGHAQRGGTLKEGVAPLRCCTIRRDGSPISVLLRRLFVSFSRYVTLTCADPCADTIPFPCASGSCLPVLPVATNLGGSGGYRDPVQLPC